MPDYWSVLVPRRASRSNAFQMVFQEQYFDDGGQAECWLAVRHAAVLYPQKQTVKSPAATKERRQKPT